MLKFMLKVALLGAVSLSVNANDQPIGEEEIDALSLRALETFNSPGMSVGIIKDGKQVFAKGYGLADIENNIPVTADTVFGIGSQTKAYTAAALAILMDEGKLTWDDKVIDHIPEFRMYDPYVTREFTIRDMLTHRSGLDLGAGDLLMFPNSESTTTDVIAALQHFKPVSSFRSKYDYDNLMYIIAGEIVTRASGMPWADFIETRIMQPLGMDQCRATRDRLPSTLSEAQPYMVVDGAFTKTFYQKSQPMAPAGAIYCSVKGHAKWLMMQLNGGKLPDGTPLFSAARHKEMWTPVTLMSPNGLTAPKYNEHFLTYGLGWQMSDMKGNLSVRHGGGLLGMVTYSLMLPEQNMAVSVNINSMNFGAMYSLVYEIVDAYLGVDNGDWIKTLETMVEARNAHAKDVIAKAEANRPSASGQPATDLPKYVGTYRDAWYGDVVVSQKSDDTLEIAFGRSPILTGPLQHFQNNTFVAYWNDRTLEADAYVSFDTDFEGNISGIKMKPVSPLTDFSFDFKHLDLKKVQ